MQQKVKNADGSISIENVAITQAIAKYDSYMGGVDKSDQFISYNRILRTKWYWKTMFYHLLEIVTTNASVIYNWLRMASGNKCISQTLFRDHLVLQIISKERKRKRKTRRKGWEK